MRFCTLAAAILLLFASAGSSRAADVREKLTVTFRTRECSDRYGVLLPHAGSPIVASVAGLTLNNWYRKTVPVSSTGYATAVFDVVPDAYYVDALQKPTLCRPSAGIVAVVLPGHPVDEKNIDISPVAEDEVAYSYVAGLVDVGITTQLLVSPDAVSCGAKIDSAVLQAAPFAGGGGFRVDGNAFYGNIADAGNNRVILAVHDSSQRALVLLPLVQNGGVSIESTYVRYDVNERVLSASASPDGSTIACPLGAEPTPTAAVIRS